MRGTVYTVIALIAFVIANLLVSYHFNQTRVCGVLVHFARAPSEVKFHTGTNLSDCRFAQFFTREFTRRMVFIGFVTRCNGKKTSK